MSKLDLTLREMQEAEGYGLTPDAYDELREKFEKRLREKLHAEVLKEAKKAAKEEIRGEISSEMRPGLRIDVEKEMRPKLQAEIEKELRAKLPDELKPKLQEELLPDLRKRVETELGEKLKSEARAATAREASQLVPTTKERVAFREYIREAEVDCLTQANSAGDESDEADSSLRWGRRTRIPFAHGLFIALPILAFFLYRQFLWTYGFWSFFVPAAFAAIAFAITVGRRHERLSNAVSENRKIASDYWVLAERAKKLRIFTVEHCQTKAELLQELDGYTRDKRELDNRYCPNAKSLKRSREEVRNQLMSDVDPEKLLRVATEPEPEETEEAEVVPLGVRKQA